LDGAYLTLLGNNLEFTPDRSKAHIFDYHADDVAARLEQARRDLGVIWIANPVDPNLVIEKCDVCGQYIRTSKAHFDGSRFRCPACVSDSSHPSA
jgi:hypothetical protein